MSARSQVITPLKGQMVRRSPTRLEQTKCGLIAITPRDEQIFQAVYQHGFLTVELIALAFFPPSGARAYPSSAAYERVRGLWAAHYLARVELPVARMLGGRLPSLFAIGPKAIPSLAASLGKDTRTVNERRLDRLDIRSIDHDLKAAAFWAHLKTLVAGKNITHWLWNSERDIRAQERHVVDPTTERRIAIIPDGEFSITYGDGSHQLSFLEVDMGTLPLRRFRKKIHGYDLYLNDLVGERENWWPEVFVLAHSQKRLEELRNATADARDEDSKVDYFFGTFLVLERRSFAAECWQDLSGEQNRLLLDPAYVPRRAARPAAPSPIPHPSDLAIRQDGLQTRFE